MKNPENTNDVLLALSVQFAIEKHKELKNSIRLANHALADLQEKIGEGLDKHDKDMTPELIHFFKKFLQEDQ